MNHKIKQILRCYSSGMGVKPISTALLLSKNTVRRYVRMFEESGIEIEKLLSMDELHLHELFYTQSKSHSFREAEYEYLQTCIQGYVKRLKVRGTTCKELYGEYIQERPSGYSYDVFCKYIRRERIVRVPIARINHISGDQVYIDFAGDKLEVADPDTGTISKVEVFAAILPYSQLIYYEAVPSQRKEHLIMATENALHYYGGVPAAIVPDNLKSAITKPSRIEPVINDEFESFAEHYGCVVFPARVRKPKDKALVEYAVRLLYREVYTKLRGMTFHNIESINAEIWRHLETLNNRKMSGRNYSRRDKFEESERSALKPLPLSRYILKQRKVATVLKNCYITLHKHYYSVPKEYLGKTMELLYDRENVEIYHNLKLVTSHKRDDTPFGYTEKPSHNLPTRPSDYTSRLETLYSQAREIDSSVEEYIKLVAKYRQYPERAYKSCKGIIETLGNKYGRDRLVEACRLALELNAWGYNEILEILSQGEDVKYRQYYDGQAPERTPMHKNLRGKNYFNTDYENGKE